MILHKNLPAKIRNISETPIIILHVLGCRDMRIITKFTRVIFTKIFYKNNLEIRTNYPN